jgi:predicted phosphodiesterase
VLTDTMRDLPDAVPRAALAPKTLRYLHGLPTVLTFSSKWGRVLLCHGLGSNDMASVMPDDFGYALDSNTELQSLMTDRDTRIIINGHTHRPMLRSFGGLTIINAGTLFREHDPGYVIADFEAGSVTWHGLARSETRVLGSLPPGLEGP